MVIKAVGLWIVLYALFEMFICVSMQSLQIKPSEKRKKVEKEPEYVFFMIVIFISVLDTAALWSVRAVCDLVCLMGRT